jgi:hypothetical protein
MLRLQRPAAQRAVRCNPLRRLEAPSAASHRGLRGLGQTPQGRRRLRRFSPTPHPLDRGLDLHARTLSVCILSQDVERLRHRHLQTRPEPLLRHMAPLRADPSHRGLQ